MKVWRFIIQLELTAESTKNGLPRHASTTEDPLELLHNLARQIGL